MRNNQAISRNKINHAVIAVERQIAKVERTLRKIDPASGAYDKAENELFQLRQKRAKLVKGLHRS